MKETIFCSEGKRPAAIALFLLVLCLPLTVRKVIFVIAPDGESVFNEYWDISLYLSDILVLIFFLCTLLQYKKCILSISWWKELFHVKHIGMLFALPLPFLLWGGLSVLWSDSQILAGYSFFKLLEGYVLYLCLILLIVPRGTISISTVDLDNRSTWNNVHSELSDNKKFHVEQLGLFSQYLIKIVPRGTIHFFQQCYMLYYSTWNVWKIISISLIFGGLFQSVVAIVQFLLQSSLGMTLLQESIVSPFAPGIAKIIIANSIFVRSYGFFPHPNVLAGYLAITILLTLAYPLIFHTRLFHVEQSSKKKHVVPRGTITGTGNIWVCLCSTWNNMKNNPMFHVEHGVMVYRMVLFIQILGLLVTFSKSAILGLIAAIVYLAFQLFHVEQLRLDKSRNMIVPRGTTSVHDNQTDGNCFTWNKGVAISTLCGILFHVEQYKKSYFLGILTITLFIINLNWYYFLIQPIQERLFFEKEFVSVISSNPFSGIGLGQSVYSLQNFFDTKLFSWQLQPIHSVFQLIIVETGFIGLMLFLFFIALLWYFSRQMRYVPRGTVSGVSLYCSTWNGVEIKDRGGDMFHVEQGVYNRTSVPRGTVQQNRIRVMLSAVMILIGCISLFDHYFYDIQQGQLLFWLIVGLLAAVSVVEE